MKEREFQSWVVEVAERFGWRVWHVPMPVRPIGDGKFVPDKRGRGLPDLIMLHEDPPRLIFAELKGDGGRLSDEQKEFLRLARCIADSNVIMSGVDWSDDSRPINVYSWRPGHQDTIEMILRGKVLA